MAPLRRAIRSGLGLGPARARAGEGPGVERDGLAGIAVPLLDRARVHGSINILWIRSAMTAEQCAARHLADLKAAASEIVKTLQDSARR